MASSSSKRKGKALEEVARLRGERRLDVIKCMIAVAGVVVILALRTTLEIIGVLETGNQIVSLIVMLAAFALAVFAATASNDFAKNGRQIKELRARYGLSDEEISAYRRQ